MEKFRHLWSLISCTSAGVHSLRQQVTSPLRHKGVNGGLWLRSVRLTSLSRILSVSGFVAGLHVWFVVLALTNSYRHAGHLPF